MWNSGDSNWGIYMAQAGAGKSLSGGTAPAGSGFSQHAIRFRTYSSDANRGWIFEGSDNVMKASIRSSDGYMYVLGNISSGGSVSATGFNFTGQGTWSGTGQTSYANYGGNRDWYIRTGNNNGKVVINDTGGVIGLGTSSVSSGFRAEVNGKLKVTNEIQCNGQIFASSDISCSTRIYAYTGARLYGTEATVNYTNAQSDYLTNGGSVQIDPPNLNFGLYVQNSIRASGIVVLSDQRIKSNIVDIHDTTALEQIRLLKPKYYEYLDKVKRGSSSVIGFIAQEVKEVLPRAVSVADGDIPNIYEIGTISSNTVTFTNVNTSNLEGTNCTLIAYLAEDKRKELTITEVVDEHTVRVEEDMSEWGSELFVWGQKVQDFHHLNKDYIFTVSTAALQEVDRQLQAERSRNIRWRLVFYLWKL
jgi:hypothetical protein